MAVQRLRQSTPCTLRVVTVDQYGKGTDRAGAVTATVTASDGTVLISAGAATGAGNGQYSVALTAAQVATLDTLSVQWADVAGGGTWYTQARVVGGFMFTIDEARDYDAVLSDDTTYPDAKVAAARAEVEDTAEWICDRSFVPAYKVVTVNGSGTLELAVPVNDIRSVRVVTLFDVVGGTGVELTASELASVTSPAHGILQRTDGGVFPWGIRNIQVGIEYGLDAPNDAMVRAAITHCRSRLHAPRTGIPDRARTVTDANGASYTLAGMDPYSTGIDAVDAVYARNSLRAEHRGVSAAGAGGDSPNQLPASRTLSYDPQWGGLFRGGPR